MDLIDAEVKEYSQSLYCDCWFVWIVSKISVAACIVILQDLEGSFLQVFKLLWWLLATEMQYQRTIVEVEVDKTFN